MKSMISALALALLAGPALAGDGYGPPVAPGLDWSGLYVGLNGGYGTGDSNYDLSTSSGAMFYNDFFDPDNVSADLDGWTAGLHAGAQKQVGRMIFGGEVDVSWTGMQSHLNASTPNTIWDIEADLEMFGTVRGRLGYLVTDRIMVYGTGGFAWGKVDAEQRSTHLPGNIPGGVTSGEQNHFGWTLGGGAEIALTNSISLRGEYLYVDLAEEEYALRGTVSPTSKTPYVETFDAGYDFHVIRGGLSYRF